MKLWTEREREREIAKFLGEVMIIYIANVQKVKLIRHLGIEAHEEVEE